MEPKTEMESYQDWKKSHFAKGGTYEKIVKAFLENEDLMRWPTFFEIKREK